MVGDPRVDAAEEILRVGSYAAASSALGNEPAGFEPSCRLGIAPRLARPMLRAT